MTMFSIVRKRILNFLANLKSFIIGTYLCSIVQMVVEYRKRDWQQRKIIILLKVALLEDSWRNTKHSVNTEIIY